MPVIGITGASGKLGRLTTQYCALGELESAGQSAESDRLVICDRVQDLEGGPHTSH